MHAIADTKAMTVPKAEPEYSQSLYDLEFRSDDDAWYSVFAVLDAPERKLTVKYFCDPQEYESVYSAGDFATEAEVEQLVARFRPVSRQPQDHQCRQLAVGTAVCAAHGNGDELKFYDAVIEAVTRQDHSFVGGEEECLCTFVLFWHHGPGDGTLTCARIGSICIPVPASQVDPRISSFAILAKEKLTSSKSISVFDSHASASKGPSSSKSNRCASTKKQLVSSQNRLQEMKSSMALKTQTRKSEDSGRIVNYNRWESQDEDMGPAPCNIDGLATAEGHHVILINNLEKDLSPSSIKKFIHQQTTILSQAFVFPRLVSDPFARGAIVVDSQKKVQIIYEFLDNPNHLIVSSKGRPWVIAEKALVGTSAKTIWNLMPKTLDDTEKPTSEKELVIVHSGTEFYERAKQLRDLFMEFIHHESEVSKRLVLEEKRVWRSFQTA